MNNYRFGKLFVLKEELEELYKKCFLNNVEDNIGDATVILVDASHEKGHDGDVEFTFAIVPKNEEHTLKRGNTWDTERQRLFILDYIKMLEEHNI